MASPLVVGFLFSPRLLNHHVGNENITIRDSWGIYFSPFAASPLIEKNPIPTSPQMRISSDMNSKLLDNFSYDLIEVLVKYFFDFFPTLFRKLTSNDLNPRIFSIEKTKKCFFFQFFIKMTSNIISELNDDFSEDFFEVLHIFVGPKIKILENRPDFLNFSAKTHNRL